ncbi:MAG: U32 family peptidase C-terminal domain-containing protein [Verrucomicrobiota bacterium]
MKQKPELMAPVGNWTCLTAALKSGADGIYFGLHGLNMRSNYRNFVPSEMPKIARQCHASGARAYLALNTIIYENELTRVDRILKSAAKAGIDAVICSDLAVVQKATALKLPVFLSTQMSLSNSEGLAFFYRTFGIRRFVLARECSLTQIRAIRRRLAAELGAEAANIQLEVFAHGAMCVSVSGRCFLSENRVGKSANRGACTQPCRREYKLLDDEGQASFRLGDNYLLSPEDLCTLPFIEQLLDAGVASLKIEGRARTPEYVSVVTTAYRRALDFYFENHRLRNFKTEFQSLKASLLKDLDGVYHRGLSPGFFMGKPVEQWSAAGGSRATQSKSHVGVVVKYYRKAGAAEIEVRAGFSVGDELMIQGPTTGVVRAKVDSMQVEHQPREKASRGDRVAIRVGEVVRSRDRVFMVTPARKSSKPNAPQGGCP